MKNIQFNQVELEIIQFLFNDQTKYQSSQSIAEYSEVSSKTIRKYIKSLNGILEEFGAVIEMKRGNGYRLKIKDELRFYRLLDLINEQNKTLENSKTLTNNKERERFILNALLLENKNLTIEDLADSMFISKSTVSTVIQMIKKELTPFDLSITYDQDGYIIINGVETNKRRFILNYFFSTSYNNITNINVLNGKYKNFSVETIFIIVLEQCREFEIQLTDFVLQNLVLHIALAIKRNEKGFTINKLEVAKEIEYSKELFVSEKIVRKLENLIDIEFPEDEAKYIALHLKSKSNNKELTSHSKLEAESTLQEQIVKALKQMYAKSGILFAIDHQLIMGLKKHFEPLMTRLKLNLKLKNPLLKDLQEKYPKVIDETKKYFSRMPIVSSYEIGDHEWAYISLHILAAIERYKQEHKLNVIVICATGLGSAQMLKSRIENEFSANINVSKVISYYQLNDEVLKNIDLIISTIDISASFYNIPVVKVSVFLNEQDVRVLNNHISEFTLLKGEVEETQSERRQLESIFNRYFNGKRFILFENIVTRENLIKEMVKTLTDASDPDFVENLNNQMDLREKFGTLAFTKDVAFPHPAQPLGLNSEIVIGVIPNGVQWDSEHESVKMVVLMSPSKIENKGLDIINKGLATFINYGEPIDELLEDASFERFKQLFLDILAN